MLVNVSEGGKVDSLLTLKRKTDVNGRPCMNKWCPDSESNQGHGDFQNSCRSSMFYCQIVGWGCEEHFAGREVMWWSVHICIVGAHSPLF